MWDPLGLRVRGAPQCMPACAVCVTLLFATTFLAFSLVCGELVNLAVPDPNGDFTVTLCSPLDTIALLTVPTLPGFSFALNSTAACVPSSTPPMDRAIAMGDVSFHVRQFSIAALHRLSSSQRRKPLAAAADPWRYYATDFANISSSPLSVTRQYRVAKDEMGGLLASLTLRNVLKEAVEVGSLGVALLVDTRINQPSAELIATLNSFSEPYIGLDHGFVKITHITGYKQVLMVIPEWTSDHIARMEGWRKLARETDGGNNEGGYEWLIHTSAYRQTEWVNITDSHLWNAPSSVILQPNETATYTLRFRLFPDVRQQEDGLIDMRRPVIKGIPGYVIAADFNNASVAVHLPMDSSVIFVNITFQPPGILHVSPTSSPLGAGWSSFAVRPLSWGRARLVVNFKHSTGVETQATASYFSIASMRDLQDTFSSWVYEKHWFEEETDPFGRAHAWLQYDPETEKLVLQDQRVWIAGISDEAGASPSLAMAMKNKFRPSIQQIARMEDYVQRTLWGEKSSPAVPFSTSVQHHDWSVRRSMFWYPNMTGYNYTIRYGWPQSYANATDRAFNYPHVLSWSTQFSEAGPPYGNLCHFLSPASSRGTPQVKRRSTSPQICMG